MTDAEIDPFKKLADSLRKKNGLPYRSAVMDDERVEYIRGKEFHKYMKQNPAIVDEYLPGPKAPQDKIGDLMKVLISRGLLVRAQRSKLKPAKGKDKLSAWPKHLTKYKGPDGNQLSVDDAFYAWTYERPTSITTYILGGLVALLVILACLFPLAPFRIKIATVYVCYALLTLILGLIVVRLVVFLSVWLATGRHIWILPNLLRDDLGIYETFATLISIDKDEKGKPVPRTGILYRLATLVALVVLGVVFYMYDTTTIAVSGIHSMHDSVLEFIDSSRGREMLAGSAGPGGARGARMPGPGQGSAFGPGSEFIRAAEKAAKEKAGGAASGGAEL